METTFHNSTGEIGQIIENLRTVAKSQKEAIRKFFKDRGSVSFTASEVHWLMPFNCISSTKRAISDLKNEGFLIKTDIKVIGEWGKPTHKYKMSNGG